MDRAVDDGDSATAVEQVQVDGSETLLVPKWQEQWDRVQRWYARLTGINVGRAHDMDLDDYWDDVLAFFQNCYHFKDWLKNDPASGVGREVEDFVKNSPDLCLCADLTNATKHLRLTTPRVDPNISLARRTLGVDETNNRIWADYDIDAAGGSKDGFQVASGCVNAWQTFLVTRDLL